MKKNDDGFSSPLAMTAIFSLSLIILSLSMLVASGEKKINAYKNFVNANKKADSLILEVEKQMQLLCQTNCDFDENDEIQNIQIMFSDYELSISDISTGINKDILNNSFLNNPTCASFFNLHEDEVKTSYGWINSAYANVQFMDSLKTQYNTDDLFPFVNSMPSYNIFYMSQEFLEAILSFNNFTNVESKAKLLKDNINKVTQINDIAELLGITSSHNLFNLLGTKTVFWNVTMKTDKFNINTVFAAIPRKDNQREIEKYILVEKEISFIGGGM